MLNATERLIFTHTWGYRDKNGNWQGIIDHLLKKEADLGKYNFKFGITVLNKCEF